jgi:hypothetical protein
MATLITFHTMSYSGPDVSVVIHQTPKVKHLFYVRKLNTQLLFTGHVNSFEQASIDLMHNAAMFGAVVDHYQQPASPPRLRL